MSQIDIDYLRNVQKQAETLFSAFYVSEYDKDLNIKIENFLYDLQYDLMEFLKEHQQQVPALFKPKEK